MIIEVDNSMSLEFLEEPHAASLFNLIDANRNYLREWLPWVDNMQAVENAENYISNCERQAEEKTDFAYAIMFEKNMVGRIGMHHINQQNKIGEIGYWLADGWQGRGIVTKCCTALINHGFNDLGLNRIEIKCATGNKKSRTIAEKLNFKQEGILREAEWLNGKFIDLYLYSILKEEWEKDNP
jgi:ribosomal-protein-serine acetyltransferase